MLLDNKTQTEDNQYYKVFDFLRNNTEQGKLDLVSGFFSVNAFFSLPQKVKIRPVNNKNIHKSLSL